MLFWLGRVEEASAAIDDAIEAAPEWAESYRDRATYSAYRENGCDVAAAALDEHRRRADDTPETWSTLGRVHAANLYHTCPTLADVELALDLARKAVAAQPANLDYRYPLGVAAFRNGNHEEARDALSTFVEPDGGDQAAAMFYLSMTLERLGDRERSRHWYDRAVARMDELYPKNPELVALRREAGELLGSGR